LNIDELESALRNSEELQLQIVRDTGISTVALLGIFDTEAGERLQLAGTGTLIEIAESHYILTAAHVWEDVLKRVPRIGITLAENLGDHVFSLDTRTIKPTGPEIPNNWGEWGPDLVYLQIPREYVGTIKAYRVFYNPMFPGDPPNVDHIQTRLLLGTPAALGVFRPNHAQLAITGFFSDVEAPVHARGQFDYIDLAVDTGAPGSPESFGGVSGGGVWKVQVYESAAAGRIDSIPTLEGVAFHQSAIKEGKRIIRCHGPASLQDAMRR
jgi:hypothetical protein